MARRPALTLASMTPARGTPAPSAGEGSAAPEQRREAAPGRVRRGQTLRLEPEAWRQLKLLAIDEGKTSHDLLVEAVNLLFDHYNRPTIAG